MKRNIPIIVAVSGHRDVIKDHEPILKEKIKNFFTVLKKQNPNTEILLLSGLAEGVDMLAAEAALEEDIKLIAVLPYEKEKYLKSFENPDEIKRFEKLYEKSYFKKILKPTKDGKYVALAKYLVKHSNILLALWDGDESEKKPGGTAYVVEMKKRGYKVENLLDINEEDMIVHIRTPRLKNPDIKEPFKIEKIYIGRTKECDYKNILHHIDKLNFYLKEKTSAYAKNIVDDLQKYFSKKANIFQKKYNFNLLFMLILAFLAILSMEAIHNFGMEHHTVLKIGTFVYFAIVIFMFLFYYGYLKNSDLKNHFVHSRGLAEALRIQSFWFCVEKEPQRAGDYYLLDEKSDLVWIRAVLKNIYFLQTLSNDKKIDFECIEKDWIEGQINYYKNAIKDRKRKYEFLEKLEKGLYALGGIFTILLGVSFWKSGFDHIEHSILFLSGISFAAAAFIGEKYLVIKGYEEDIKDFELMYYNFLTAKEMIKIPENQDKRNQIIYDLGEKALKENSRWLVYHSKYKIKPIVE